MKYLLAILIAFSTAFIPVHADQQTDLAQKIYDWLKAGQADSILAHSSSQVKAALTPQLVQNLWPQLLMQGGELQDEKDWTQTTMQGYEVRQKLLLFERTTLRLNVVLGQEMLMEGINFSPAPRPEKLVSKTEEKGDTAGFTERPFVVKHGNIELPGTLTLPVGCTGKVPAVVLVQGSGPSDRDETIGSNKPFRDLAHALARKGIAVARYDKRTLVYNYNMPEVSGGKVTFRTETADDAAEAVRIVSEMPEVDAQRVFVLGHSQGGTCLPLIVEAAKVKPAGLIGMAALARPFWQAVHEQLSYIYAANDSIIAQAEQQMRGSLPDDYLDFIESYKPLEAVTKLKNMSLLFLQGGHDYQVTETDLNLWREALKKNKKAEFQLFPTLDHLFRPLPQMATPADYTKAIPMADEAVEAVANFILKN